MRITAYTKAQMRATNKYIKKSYDQVSIVVPKGMRQVWKDAAAENGLSLTQFIQNSVNKEIESKKMSGQMRYIRL